MTDSQGTVWTIVQAFGGVGESAAATRAAERAAGRDGFVAVVCTPSGGSQTVRAELPLGWEQAASDHALLEAIGGGDRMENGAER